MPSGLSAEGGCRCSRDPGWGKCTAYGAVLESPHKGALVSFGWGAWAPGETRLRPLQPRPPAPDHPAPRPTDAGAGGAPGRPSWGCGARALSRMGSFASTSTWGPKGEGTGVTRPRILSKKFATRNKNSNGNHKKGHLGSFINNATKRPGSSGPVPEDAYRGALGSATTGDTEVLNARKLL